MRQVIVSGMVVVEIVVVLSHSGSMAAPAVVVALE
jgi:hypothetical protein